MKSNQVWVRLINLRPTTVGVLAGLVFLAPAVAIGSLLYFEALGSLKDTVRQNLVRLANAAAVLVDPETHKGFKDPSQEATEEYASAIKPLKAFQDSDKEIAFVYTMVLVDGEFRFILDPTQEGDENGDGVDDKSHVMEVYEDATPAMVQTFKTGMPTADEEPTEDAWGTFISGYAPVRDRAGTVVAIVGVDLEAGRYAHRLSALTEAGRWAAIVSALMFALIALVARSMHERYIAYQQEQRAAAESLQDLAEGLDRANERLRRASHRFQQLFNLLPVACFTLDADGLVFEWNQESERLTGLPAPAVIQRRFIEAVVSKENAGAFDGVLEASLRGRPTTDLEWADVTSDGKPFTAVLNAFPLVGPSGEITGTIAACADITVRKQMETQIESQMKEIQAAYRQLDESRNELQHMNAELTDANARLQQLAAIDGLTGLLNRRRVYEILAAETMNVKSTGLPLSILMIDIDHFKRLNDSRGHLVGDSMLKMVASALKSAVRDQDAVGRYGGEELIVVLPGTDEKAALCTAERIRKQIESRSFQGNRVTVSIGVETCYDDSRTSEQMVGRADRALYAAKERGRNQVVHIDGINLTEAA